MCIIIINYVDNSHVIFARSKSKIVRKCNHLKDFSRLSSRLRGVFNPSLKGRGILPLGALGMLYSVGNFLTTDVFDAKKTTKGYDQI